MLSYLLIAFFCLQTPQPAGIYDKFDNKLMIHSENILVQGSVDDGVLMTALRLCPGKSDCEPKEITLAFIFTGEHVATSTELNGLFLIDGQRKGIRFTFRTAKYDLGDTYGQSFAATLSRKDMMKIVDGREVACRINGYEFDFTDEQLEQLKSVFGAPKVP